MQSRFKLALILSVTLCGGCTAGRMWMPQQPGNVSDPGAASPVYEPRAQISTNTRVNSSEPEIPAAIPSSESAVGTTDGAAQVSIHPYTQVTRYGDLLFLSGQIGEGGTIEQQTTAAMEKIEAILRAHSLNVSNIVQATVYLTRINDLAGMESAYAARFRASMPARTVIGVNSLPRGSLVQITVIVGR